MTELNTKELLCLELSLVEGIGLKRFADLYAEFRSIEAIWNASESALLKVVPPKPAAAILKGPNLKRSMQIAEKWLSENVQFCTLESAVYPERLRMIYDAPPVLFYSGDSRLFQSEMMSVVGARRCTPYGRRAAEDIGYRLAKSGYTVVSGLAYGIDAHSHLGALQAHGKTIAVLANGVDLCYPVDHYRLWEQIRAQGLLVSEYPPGTEPRAGFFPLRNRIISGLSQGVIIVEAAAKSGSLITADQALEQGRDVYCVPGSIYSKMSCGVHRLVQQGAILLSGMDDLPVLPQRPKTPSGDLTETERAVYEGLTEEGLSVQELAERITIPFQEVLQALSMMEIRGIIRYSDEQRIYRV